MFEQFMGWLRSYAQRFSDVRKGVNHQMYTVADACLSAFGVFSARRHRFWPINAKCRCARDGIMPKVSLASRRYRDRSCPGGADARLCDQFGT